MTTLADLNALDQAGFVAKLGAIYEHAPWVAEAAFPARPFGSVAALHAAMAEAVAEAAPEAQMALLQGHPELARPAELTAHSAAEQAALGLDRLAETEASQFAALNAAYRARFGFPFILAVRGARDRAAILAALQARLHHAGAHEMAVALAEVDRIARYRLDHLFAPPATGRLTVHVLDVALGRPAVAMALDLFRLEGEARTHLGRFHTNADGRCDQPVLAGTALRAGLYEVVFAVAAWRAEAGHPGTGFYDDIPIRFRIDQPGGHYHVPLILAPHGYSTYRGS